MIVGLRLRRVVTSGITTPVRQDGQHQQQGLGMAAPLAPQGGLDREALAVAGDAPLPQKLGVELDLVRLFSPGAGQPLRQGIVGCGLAAVLDQGLELLGARPTIIKLMAPMASSPSRPVGMASGVERLEIRRGISE